MGGFGARQFPPPQDKPWWRHLLWIVPIAIVIGVALFLLRPDRTRPQPQRVEQPQPITQPPLTNLPPRTVDTNQLPQVRIDPGQVLTNTNGAAQWREIGRSFPATNNAATPTNISQFPLRRIDWGPPTGRTPTEAATEQTPKNSFELQLALDQRGFSPGNIDGLAGGQTTAALRAFQAAQKLPITGVNDTATRAKLSFFAPAWATYTITTNDLARLLPLGTTWTEKSQQPRIDYETLLELVAERHHTSQRLLQQENPGVDWARLTPGTAVKVPNLAAPTFGGRAAQIRIRLSENTLQVFDETGQMLLHFPCSIATRVERRPVGDLKVATVAPNPDYAFDPANFPTSPEALRNSGKLMLKPGPNNPVGVAWIGLDRPGYGIHGTPDPDKVGRTTSLGCFRLANWNAERLLPLVRAGTPVVVEQ